MRPKGQQMFDIMKRILFTKILFIFSIFSWAQVEVVSVYPDIPPKKNQRIAAQTVDTLSLPFFDDFTKTETGSLNTNIWIEESGVFVNNNFCQNPPNFRVASFDGTNRFGIPYSFLPNTDDISLTVNDFTDNLISKPIDLSTITPTSNLVFSFYWQKGGLTEHHEPTEVDSLYLYFLDLDSNWVKVWPRSSEQIDAVKDAKNGEFYSQFISITDTNYFHKGFQFRFTTFGRATGPWDLWSVDYILLDSNRTNELIVDFGYSNTPPSLLKEYESMPFQHFLDNPIDYLISVTQTKIKSLSIEPNIVKDSTVLIRELVTKTTLDSTNIEDTKVIQPLTDYEVTWDFSPSTIATNIEKIKDQEYALIGTTFNLSSSASDTVTSNNSITKETLLANYYAYDDGTAEGGIGIREYGLVAYKYDIKKNDDLTAVSIYFPKIEVNMANTALNIRVWKTLEGIDGATQDELLGSVFSQLIYSDSTLNEFFTYTFSSPIPVEAGWIYIGYEQPNSLYRLYVGLDENTNNIDRYYYRSGGSWNQDFLAEGVKGSVMIRPKFGEDPIIGLPKPKIETQETYQIYPNPTTGVVNIEGNFDQLTVTDLTGKILLKSQENQINLDMCSTGMYLIHLFYGSQKTVKKIILN